MDSAFWRGPNPEFSRRAFGAPEVAQGQGGSIHMQHWAFPGFLILRGPNLKSSQARLRRAGDCPIATPVFCYTLFVTLY